MDRSQQNDIIFWFSLVIWALMCFLDFLDIAIPYKIKIVFPIIFITVIMFTPSKNNDGIGIQIFDERCEKKMIDSNTLSIVLLGLLVCNLFLGLSSSDSPRLFDFFKNKDSSPNIKWRMLVLSVLLFSAVSFIAETNMWVTSVVVMIMFYLIVTFLGIRVLGRLVPILCFAIAAVVLLERYYDNEQTSNDSIWVRISNSLMITIILFLSASLIHNIFHKIFKKNDPNMYLLVSLIFAIVGVITGVLLTVEKDAMPIPESIPNLVASIIMGLYLLVAIVCIFKKDNKLLNKLNLLGIETGVGQQGGGSIPDKLDSQVNKELFSNILNILDKTCTKEFNKENKKFDLSLLDQSVISEIKDIYKKADQSSIIDIDKSIKQELLLLPNNITNRVDNSVRSIEEAVNKEIKNIAETISNGAAPAADTAVPAIENKSFGKDKSSFLAKSLFARISAPSADKLDSILETIDRFAPHNPTSPDAPEITKENTIDITNMPFMFLVLLVMFQVFGFGWTIVIFFLGIFTLIYFDG